MTKEEENIDKYLDGELSGAESIEFEKKMKIDEGLRKNVSINMMIQEELSDKRLNKLKINLDRAYKSFRKPKSRLVLFSYKYVAAATIAVLVSVGILLTQRMKEESLSVDLMSEFYSPYSMNQNFRTVVSDKNDLLMLALENYENGDYSSARKSFEEISKTDPDNYAVLFYLGITYIETEAVDKAVLMFDKIIDNKGNLFVEQSEWYKGICYLKLDKKEEAFKQFEIIAANDGFFKKRANEILEKL